MVTIINRAVRVLERSYDSHPQLTLLGMVLLAIMLMCLANLAGVDAPTAAGRGLV